jgi:hypothetical protein
VDCTCTLCESQEDSWAWPWTVSSSTSSWLVPCCYTSSWSSYWALIPHWILICSPLSWFLILSHPLPWSHHPRMPLPLELVPWAMIGAILVACTHSAGPNQELSPSHNPLLWHHKRNIFPFWIGLAASEGSWMPFQASGNHPWPPWCVCYSRDICKAPIHHLEQTWLYTEVIRYDLGESQCIPQR